MKKPRLHWPVVLLALAVLLVVSVRIRLLTTPLERDEGEFAYAGQLMLQGIPPYQLFYNMKLPGIYAAYAAIMAVFGQSDAGIHVGALLVNLAAVWLLYCLARRFLDVPGAAVAAASYALLSVSPEVLGPAAHATQFVVAAALAGLLLLWRGEEKGGGAWYFCGGLMLGVACLMKQPGAMFGLFGLCWLAARGPWRTTWRKMALYVAGFAAPLLLTALVLWRAGVFERFWFWTFVYSKMHASEFTWRHAGWPHLKGFFAGLPYDADGLFWILGGLGLVCLVVSRGDLRKKIWLTGLLVFSSVAVSLSNLFSMHYFIMALPALCLLAGEAVAAARQWLSKRGPAWAILPAGGFILIWLLTVFVHRAVFFEISPDQASKEMYGSNPFVECRQIGRYLGEEAAPGATIAVLGSEPEIPFYARRHSATSYIYMYDLIDPQPYAGDMQREAIAQIEAARPEYLVFVNFSWSWDLLPDFHRAMGTDIMTWMPKFARTYYEPAGLAVIQDEPKYYWGAGALDHVPSDAPFISIYKRK